MNFRPDSADAALCLAPKYGIWSLAMMDHPSIAKVFDGGATETGRPDFVMELVRGICITDYCDQLKLNVRERLQALWPLGTCVTRVWPDSGWTWVKAVAKT